MKHIKTLEKTDFTADFKVINTSFMHGKNACVMPAVHYSPDAL